ncbi:TylF/MycF family methyltransferase [Amycolatopsis magusensis]|uniref:TylF/MycF family methyltransferase n=1 Tax=Amycolatopsis magusensis TaxID=882444 RepID=UPI003C2D721E
MGESAMEDGRVLYLDLMKKVLTNVIYADPAQAADWYDGSGYEPEKRENGLDWPTTAHTMVGLKRLDNLQFCVERVLVDEVPGDFVETGVWRGGASIFTRAVLRAHGNTDRTVWLADSFQGMPETTDDSHPVDRYMALHKSNDQLAVSLEQVQANFRAYDLLDEQVRFLEGWFADTLPTAPIERIAVLRLDGDLYDSTMDALESLYPKVSPGGYVIVDDYVIPSCKEAVHDYRTRLAIDDEIVPIDASSAYWRRAA